MARWQQNTYPRTLDEDGVTLRNGTRIRWSDTTQYRVTKVYMNPGKRYLNTLHRVSYGSRSFSFSSHQLEDYEAVVKFIESHLPAAAFQ